MEGCKQERLLSRSKSAGSLDNIESDFDFDSFSARFCGYSGRDNRHASVSSLEPCFRCDGLRSSTQDRLDSGVRSLDGEILLALEHKVDKLSELLQEQHNLLMSIKQKVNNFNAVVDRRLAVRNNGRDEDSKTEGLKTPNETKIESPRGDVNGARSPLGAIETSQSLSLDHMIRDALENFLQSDEVCEGLAAATAASARGWARGGVGRALRSAYLPMLEYSHARLVRHVTKLLHHSFANLEDSMASWFKSLHRSSRRIQMSLKSHQSALEESVAGRHVQLLRDTMRDVVEEEVCAWRARVLQELAAAGECDSGDAGSGAHYPLYEEAPASPMQPANPNASPIDTLMRSAIIKKRIESGDAAGAFEEALSSADLALVMAACRAAGPGAAGALRPAALLALLQQLAADMVHDTHLKCRYLEEALLRLKTGAGEGAPRVLRAVREHLTRFLLCYPQHSAGRRVALLVLATTTLM